MRFLHKMKRKSRRPPLATILLETLITMADWLWWRCRYSQFPYQGPAVNGLRLAEHAHVMAAELQQIKQFPRTSVRRPAAFRQPAVGP